jgi:hypothetical protein
MTDRITDYWDDIVGNGIKTRFLSGSESLRMIHYSRFIA